MAEGGKKILIGDQKTGLTLERREQKQKQNIMKFN